MELNSATGAWLNNFLVYGFSINLCLKSGITFIKGKPTESKRAEDER